MNDLCHNFLFGERKFLRKTMRRLSLLLLILLLAILPLSAQDFSLANIITQSASASDAEFTILLFALGASDSSLLEQLSDPNSNLTMLAPSDNAFVEFLAKYQLSLSDLLSRPIILNQLVRYHILNDSLSSSEISAAESLDTLLANNSIAVSMQRNTIRLNETTQIVRDGFAANNGILHLIDEVLVPPSLLASLNHEGADRTIAEFLQSRADLSFLAAALEQNGLLETFSDASGNFTLFAPNNAAFEALGLSADTISGDVLLYHALELEADSNALLAAASFPSLQGANIQSSYRDGNIFLNEQAFVVELDIQTRNGIVHVINQVLSVP
jgi:transforming growth factor-beta-induced protein